MKSNEIVSQPPEPVQKKDVKEVPIEWVQKSIYTDCEEEEEEEEDDEDDEEEEIVDDQYSRRTLARYSNYSKNNLPGRGPNKYYPPRRLANPFEDAALEHEKFLQARKETLAKYSEISKNRYK